MGGSRRGGEVLEGGEGFMGNSEERLSIKVSMDIMVRKRIGCISL